MGIYYRIYPDIQSHLGQETQINIESKLERKRKTLLGAPVNKTAGAPLEPLRALGGRESDVSQSEPFVGVKGSRKPIKMPKW